MGNSTINILSLCTGAGGLDLGLALAVPTARVVCCVEHEAYAIEDLATRMEEKALDAAPVWTDLRTFDGRPWRGVVDCVIGGYPCQPFSHAGKRLGEDDPRHLWPHIARILAEIEPPFCFFENVAGHLTLGFDAVRDALAGMGYRVAAGLFTAAEVGASHRRQRLFIMAHRAAGGFRELWQPSGGNGFADGGGEAVADHADAEGRRDGPQRGSDGRAAVGRAGAAMADAGRNGGKAGISGQDTREEGDAGESDYSGFEIPVFPPGPDALDAWRGILAGRPDLAPAIESPVRGVAHGMAHRLDELRLTGNGVVPLEAAYAFVSLLACICDE